MPPRPPRGKKAKDTVWVMSSVATQYPQAGASAARCIAIGAQIESLYGAILTTMLGANAAPAAAMYGSLRSISAQTSAVLAAAEAVLNKDEMDLFSVVTAICNRALKHRHRLAHWVWAQSNGYPGALVLIDPTALLGYELGIGRFQYPNEGRGLLDNFDPTSSLIYDQSALNEAVKELVEAENYLAQFRFAVIPSLRKNSAESGLGLPQLATQPAIAVELRAMKQRRQKNPTTPTRPRGRGRST